MLAIVDQIFVCFVSDDDEIAFLCERGNGFRFFRCEDDAARVLWRVVVDRAVRSVE